MRQDDSTTIVFCFLLFNSYNNNKRFISYVDRHPTAAQIGAEILKKGGNVAVCLLLS